MPVEQNWTPEQRFWAKVEMRPSGCWEWTGRRDSRGYGRISAPRGLHPRDRGLPAATLGCHVLAVQAGVPQEHVEWVHAGRVVAVVAHEQARWDLAVEHLPREAVSSQGWPAESPSPGPGSIQSGLPGTIEGSVESALHAARLAGEAPVRTAIQRALIEWALGDHQERPVVP